MFDYEKNPFAIKKNINISIKHTDRTNSIGFRPQETVKGRSLRQTIKGLSMKRPSTGGGPQIENTYARLGKYAYIDAFFSCIHFVGQAKFSLENEQSVKQIYNFFTFL